MPHRIEATIAYQEQVFPPGTPTIASYRIELRDALGALVDFRDLPSAEATVVFPAPAHGSNYVVRAGQRDSQGNAIGVDVASAPFDVTADVTLLVVRGVTVRILTG